jgi:hypothetical protein
MYVKFLAFLILLDLIKELYSPRIISAVLCVYRKPRVVPYKGLCHRNWIQSTLLQLAKESTAT